MRGKLIKAEADGRKYPCCRKNGNLKEGDDAV